MALYSDYYGLSYVGYAIGAFTGIVEYTKGGTYYDIRSLSAITPRTGVASQNMTSTNATEYDVALCAFVSSPTYSFSNEYRDTGSTNTTKSKINNGGNWKYPSKIKLNIGGTWKDLQK